MTFSWCAKKGPAQRCFLGNAPRRLRLTWFFYSKGSEKAPTSTSFCRKPWEGPDLHGIFTAKAPKRPRLPWILTGKASRRLQLTLVFTGIKAKLQPSLESPWSNSSLLYENYIYSDFQTKTRHSKPIATCYVPSSSVTNQTKTPKNIYCQVWSTNNYLL